MISASLSSEKMFGLDDRVGSVGFPRTPEGKPVGSMFAGRKLTSEAWCLDPFVRYERLRASAAQKV